MAIYTASYIPVDKCHTLSEFLSVGRSANIISYTKLSFLENNYVVKNILDDYMFELKRSAVDVKLSDEEYTKYRFRPKLLSYDVYDSIEFFYVILKLNNMEDYLLDDEIITVLQNTLDALSLSAVTRFGFEKLIAVLQETLGESFSGQDPGGFLELPSEP